MNITLLSATRAEIQPTIDLLDAGIQPWKDIQVDLLVTGVGLPATIYQLTKYLAKSRPDLIVQAGIAGAFSEDIMLGEVVLVESENFGDLGAEDQAGDFLSLVQLGLQGPQEPPFQNGSIPCYNPSRLWPDLRRVTGTTVQLVHGEAERIHRFTANNPAEIESMEGAGVAYVASLEQIPCLQLRSISNYVEPRNREAWKIGLSVQNLNRFLLDGLHHLANL
ncbi:MAG: futalosine hydrolase [Bacteroidota bacterium]